VHGGFLRIKKMEQKILRIELDLARKFRGLFLIEDQHSAERAERILQSIRRQARALAAQSAATSVRRPATSSPPSAPRSSATWA